VPVLIALSAAVGCVGGIYGIGGGSILAPILIGSGRSAVEVAPAALASTFVTSVGGVITFTILSLHQHGPVAPDWSTRCTTPPEPRARTSRAPGKVAAAQRPWPGYASK